MHQKIGEIIWDLAMLGIFTYYALTLLGKIKPERPVQEFEHPTLLLKMSVFGGTIAFALMVIIEFIR